MTQPVLCTACGSIGYTKRRQSRDSERQRSVSGIRSPANECCGRFGKVSYAKGSKLSPGAPECKSIEPRRI